MTMDISTTIEADSTQINADDLTASPRTVTVTGVSKGTADQPVNIEVAEFPGRSYRPCKSMRRVLVTAWGSDASQYVGRRMTLFNDPSVKWGGMAVGGVRIAALSHIDKPLTVSLTETRGKKKPHKVDVLPDAPTPSSAPSLGALFEKAGLAKDQAADRLTVTRRIVGRTDITKPGDLTPDELTTLTNQLLEWDSAGQLKDRTDDLLDAAAIEAESAK